MVSRGTQVWIVIYTLKHPMREVLNIVIGVGSGQDGSRKGYRFMKKSSCRNFVACGE